SYCATCVAPLFKNKVVAVIGGSNSAVMSALLLTKYAKKIYLIYRGKELRAEPIQVEKLKKNKKIKILYNSEIKKIKGKDFIESIVLNNKKKLKASGV
ncbi:MAG: NAD-binding protein, partial [Candidatus Pacearchaeota archaeon]|nr:NAD-binding protein [Candidatus Pacearchaeota archaeon]